MKKEETLFAGKTLSIETGRLAGQANGSVTVRYGDTLILATAVITEKPRPGIDFLPLLVDYEERFYAAGKISGSRFVKREGRPSEFAILNARMIDRAIRPLFPKDFRNDVQVVITVLSIDNENDPSILGMIGASAALMMAGAPIESPVAAVRIGLNNDEIILNPNMSQFSETRLNLVAAASDKAVLMIEAGANEVSEEVIIEAIETAFSEIQKVNDLQKKLSEGIKIISYPVYTIDEALIQKAKEFLKDKMETALRQKNKQEQEAKVKHLEEELFVHCEASENEKTQFDLRQVFFEVLKKGVRNIILSGTRTDGRNHDEIRPLSLEVGLLPRTHGSAIFSRGQTQVLSAATLGSLSAEQIIDTMELDTTKRYMHHYTFPAFSSGEVKPNRGASRREIGHGALAEKALVPMIPDREIFPYTIRIASEVLSSNGSTSMASVCASSLSLMDAGVPIKKHVAGIAMGLILEETGKHTVLTDIMGIEDGSGDMDFKVAGTEDGITALQLDIKVSGITFEIMRDAFLKAKNARLFILNKMNEIIAAPRTELSLFAPRVVVININPDKIRDVIGPGGKVINSIIDKTGVTIDIEDDGMVRLFSSNVEKIHEAQKIISDLTKEVQAGEVYDGTVTRIMNFGAFVEILPGIEGLVHISQLADYRVERVEDIVKVGQKITVFVLEIDQLGRINLSLKAAAGLKPGEHTH